MPGHRGIQLPLEGRTELGSGNQALLSLQHCLLCCCLQHRKLQLGRGCFLLLLLQLLPCLPQPHQHGRLLGTMASSQVPGYPLRHLAPPLHAHACESVQLTSSMRCSFGTGLCRRSFLALLLPLLQLPLPLAALCGRGSMLLHS